METNSRRRSQNATEACQKSACFCLGMLPKNLLRLFLTSERCIFILGAIFHWEVLNGVGVDGVGVIFPFFYAFFVF